MWPPAPRPGYYPYPQMRPPLNCPSTFGHPSNVYQANELIQPRPFIPLVNAPPWHQNLQSGDSWRPLGGMESWRSLHRQNNPWSNHEISRNVYTQLPRSLRHSQFSRSGILDEYEQDSQVAQNSPDYEKQLRENYEQSPNMYSDFSVSKIELHPESSARRIRLAWRLPTLADANEKYKIHLTVRLDELEGGIGRGARKGQLGIILNEIFPIHVTRTEFETIPGSLYNIEMNVIGQRRHDSNTSANISVRAVFSLDEMKVLMQKALNFTGTLMHQFTYLYRCKPKIYWDYLYNERGQIMHTYIKDSNGQAATPINQNIDGLFFSARTNPDGSLPISSPFGDIRMVIPAMTLLDPSKVNLYFADFYCNRVTHYVTVVVTIPGSSSDSFCQEKLIKLDPFANLFLRFQTTSNPNIPIIYFVNKKIWVEIFYTENIPMRWARFDNIMAAGVGTSKIGGLPHNKHCQICNLYPIGVSAVPQPPEHITPIPQENAELMIKEAIKAEFVDLNNSDDNCEDEFEPLIDDRQKESDEFLSYKELKNRLQKLEQQISVDPNNKRSTSRDIIFSHESLFKELITKIENFVEEMGYDFTVLEADVDHMEKKTHDSIISVEKMNPKISGTVDALIDNQPKSHHINKRGRQGRRRKKFSVQLSLDSKRRRDSF